MTASSPPEVPTPDVPQNISWADAEAPKREQKEWSRLDELRERNDGWWLTAYGVVLVAITVTFSFLFLVTLVIWSIHYLAPDSLTWLSDQQLSKVQSVLFSGGMGAIITSVVRKQIDKN